MVVDGGVNKMQLPLRSTLFCYIYDRINLKNNQMKRISFYVMEKDFNTGDIETYDVMPSLYGSILTSNNKVSKRFVTRVKMENKNKVDKKGLRKFINSHFLYLYAYKCEWEFIVSDWPPVRDNGREKKIDAYMQLKPNIDLITDIVWEQIKDKIKDDE